MAASPRACGISATPICASLAWSVGDAVFRLGLFVLMPLSAQPSPECVALIRGMQGRRLRRYGRWHHPCTLSPQGRQRSVGHSSRDADARLPAMRGREGSIRQERSSAIGTPADAFSRAFGDGLRFNLRPPRAPRASAAVSPRGLRAEIALSFYWRARRDSNPRPPDSKLAGVRPC